MPPTRTPLSPVFLATLVLLAAVGHAIVALLGVTEKSTTSDELAHITGGYTFNHWHDYRLHPENGILPQRWQALPTTLAGAHFPEMSGDAWREANVWMVGHSFFYGLGNNHEWMLFTARAMNSVFGVATVLLVAFWASRLFGNAGAAVAVVFAIACPTMLAHSALATSDMAMGFFLIASASAYWWHLNDPRLRVAALSAGVFGLACVAKYSAVLLPPLFILLALARAASPSPLVVGNRRFASPRARCGALLGSIVVHGLAGIGTIWAFCGFRYAAFNPELPGGDFTIPWAPLLAYGGLKAEVVDFFRTWRILPEGYLYGLMFVLKHAEARGAFLDGEYSIFGWVSFFPKTFLYKTPPSLLAALALFVGLMIAWVRAAGLAALRRNTYRALPLILFFVLYWIVSLTSNLNIGHRHILPTYPVLYIATGIIGWAIARSWSRARAGGVALAGITAALLAWHVSEGVRIHPHHLAYFSPAVGGPSQGYKRLADSSLDWGQDLPGLKRWLDEHRRPGEPVFLSYFGTSEPDYYGIEAIRMPMIHTFDRSRPWYWPEPGLFVLSATMLQHVYMPIRGEWTAESEERYQNFRQIDGAFRAFKERPESRAELLGELTLEEWNRAWGLYENLRFARLCHYLRARRPDAMIGYSILVYRLDQNAIDNALNKPLSEMMDAIKALR